MVESPENARPLSDLLAERLADQRYDLIFTEWSKGLSRLNDDAGGAITVARTLIESVSKLILDELEIPYDEKLDLPKLYHAVSKELGISPVPQTDDLMRAFFGATQTIVNRVGEMRNKFGDAHGRGRLSFPVPISHAELAVNLAGSLCCFLISSLESTVATKKLISPDGKVVLKFNVAEVQRLIDHAQHAPKHIRSFGEKGKVKPRLWLVGDSGIYLMSNGDPPMSHTGLLIRKKKSNERRFVVHAFGCDPAYNALEDWWGVHNAIDDGNDFSITIPIKSVDEVIRSCKSELIILVQRGSYAIMSDDAYKNRSAGL